MASLKKRIEALTEEAARYRGLIESSHDWVWEVDERGVYTYASNHCRDLLGYAPEELVGRTPFDLMPLKEARRVREVFKTYAKEHKSFRRLENVNQRKDGVQVILETNGSPIFDARGRFRGYRGMDRDITQRKLAEDELRESEERYRRLVRVSPSAVLVCNADRITLVNDAALALFGATQPGRLLGKSVFSIIHPEDQADARYRIKKVVDEGMIFHLADRQILRLDGTERTVEIEVVPLPEKGKASVLAVFHDISERKQLEKEILHISERERQRIGEDLHDELCQLLSGIKFKSTLLEQRLADKSLPEASEAKAMEELLNKAIEQGRILARGLRPVELEAGGLMSALQQLAVGVASMYGATCQCEVSQPVFIEDHLVAIHLYRIAQEAINNALRHGKAKRLWVHLSSPNDRVTLSVKDNGIGFWPKQKGKGGLGLRLMHHRARSIGASLEVVSRPKRGTLITCRMRSPLERDSSARL